MVVTRFTESSRDTPLCFTGRLGNRPAPGVKLAVSALAGLSRRERQIIYGNPLPPREGAGARPAARMAVSEKAGFRPRPRVA